MFRFLVLASSLFISFGSFASAQNEASEQEYLFQILDFALIAQSAQSEQQKAEALSQAISLAEQALAAYPNGETASSLTQGGFALGNSKITLESLRNEFATVANPACQEEPSLEFCEALKTLVVDSVTNDVQTCPSSEYIVQLADFIIAKRIDLPGFSSNKFGSDAAYFRFKYGNQSFDDLKGSIARISREGRRPARDAEVLLSAATVSLGSDEEVQNYVSSVDARQGLDPRIIRALLLRDNGKFLAQIFNARLESDDQRANFQVFSVNGAYAVSDLSDLEKLELAEVADSAGVKGLAALILASHTDLSHFEKYAANLDNISSMAISNSVSIMVAGNFTKSELIKRGWGAAELAYHDILRAQHYSRGMDVLGLLVNTTGWVDEVSKVSRDYVQAVQKGELLPEHDTEVAQLFILDGLIAEVGAGRLAEALSAFSPPPVRHFSSVEFGSTGIFDSFLAKASVAEFLKNSNLSAPRKPEFLGNFDWETWEKLAIELRINGKLSENSQSWPDTPIAVELYYLNGDYRTAINLSTTYLSEQNDENALLKALSIAQDLMIRFDRMCEGYSIFPGKVYLPGRVVYRF
ncbi:MULTISPECIES: hypothetical protein [unclassified Ruegeria]|uniref:hypothetical protein n=1 Tax=unclassified Ruegeria TaxID=2625375 RepID=UPI001488CFBF|nr:MULTISPECIES: hypothetical protein [unclassified Ruegeria]